MIDPDARHTYAKLLRAFATGRITNREYEAGIPVSDDPSLAQIDDYLVWPLYDDFHSHRLKEKSRLSLSGRKAFARCILFLNSSNRYTWPQQANWTPSLLLNGLTLGWASRRYNRLEFSFGDHGDIGCWPFRQRVDMQSEASKPRLGLSLVYKQR
jgi:hypothetical protein